MQPGNNYLVAATVFSDDGLGSMQSGNAALPYFVSAYVDEVRGGFGGALSPLLTVWRKLHLEIDSMGPWPATGDEKNFDAGLITAIATNKPSSGQSILQLNIRLTDEKNRFADGYIEIAGAGRFTVLANSDNWVWPDTVLIQGVPSTNVVGQSFVIYDDDAVQMGSRPPRTMPYTLSGGTLINTAFADGYIEPEPVAAGYIDNDVPFNRNLDAGFVTYYTDWLPTINHSRDLDESPIYWYAYLLAAFQPAASEDSDPDYETPTLGQADPYKNSAAIYVEPIREKEVTPHYPRIIEEHAVVHEIGHMCGGVHDDKGIMTDGAPRNQNKFKPITIFRFRQATTF